MQIYLSNSNLQITTIQKSSLAHLFYILKSSLSLQQLNALALVPTLPYYPGR
jgi:hypothetical protein